ncbi:MAG: hypothetical protein ACRYG8_12650 [Janthinobacterium lividum]
MAEHAHITPPLSRRRSLFAAASAVVLGSGITAGAAASVADLVPAEPDADLIRLCAAFDVLERRRQHAANSARTNEQEKVADRVWEEVCREQAPMLTRMCSLPCTTLAGLGALAASLVLWDSGEMNVQEDDVQGLTIDRLTTAVLRAALAGRA